MVDGAVVRGLIAGDGRVSAGKTVQINKGTFALVCTRDTGRNTCTSYNNVL